MVIESKESLRVNADKLDVDGEWGECVGRKDADEYVLVIATLAVLGLS